MKQLTIILLGLIGVAYGQSSPTSAKTRFVNGIYLGTKLDSYFNAADSNAVYWRADSALMAKYKGTARRLLFASDSSIYLTNVVRTFGNQTVNGIKTFGSDLVVNGLTVGRGAGSNSGSVALGVNALTATTSGTQPNIAIGNASMRFLTTSANNIGIGSNIISGATTSASSNVIVGHNSLSGVTSGDNNTTLGNSAARFDGSSNIVTSINNSTFIGGNTKPSATTGVTNETVLGYNATGNGSNTVTIGNSSVTDNYFTGRTRSANFLATDSVIVGATMADVSYAFKSKSPSAFGAVIENTEATPTGNPILLLRSRSGSTISTSHTFTNNGRLGVGTSTPSATIHVLGASLTSGNSQTIGMFRSGSNTFLDIVQANNATVAGQNITGSTIASTDAIAFATNGIGTLATERLRIAANGNITSISIYDATVGGTNRDVFVDNTGLIGYVSSFRASKKNIKPLYAAAWIHKLNPVTFNYRVKDSLGNYTDSAYKELEYGLVAEEVETVNKEMVFYDLDSSGNKKLRGVHYSKLIIPLLAEVQEHKKRIDAQDKIIEALLTRIKALEAKLN